MNDTEQTDELSTADRVKNAVIGAGIGLGASGAVAAMGGAIVSLIIGKSVKIGLFGGLTAPQVSAVGILVYNTIAFLAPLIGITIEPIEYGTPSTVPIPNNARK